MATATFVKERNGNGVAAVYRLDPPYSRKDWGDDEPHDVTYVWVSAVSAFGTGPETYIFESTEDGEVVDWGEMEGSYRGGFDHQEALRGLGYEVTA